jgi:cbb3-type cytochrome oxidase subunit 3
MSVSTTEFKTNGPGLATVKYIRLKKRWRWNPQKGLAHLVLFLFILFFALIFFYYSAGKRQGQAPAREVTVEKGDTLWEIALRYYPHTDPRKPVAAIKNLNNLKTSVIYAGQKLRLPESLE